MKCLSVAQVLELHVLAIHEFGGSDGLRDLGRLEAAIAVQEQAVFGQELYVTIYDKAAALIRGIIGGHPFVDGNKRTAMLSGLTLLEINGKNFTAQKGLVEDFAVQVAVEKLDVPTIAAWLKSQSKPQNA